MKALSIYLAALIAGCLVSYAGVRYYRALDDLHSISTDIHAIRESLSSKPVKIQFRYGPSKMTPAPKKIILA